jgi:mannose-6-phosphate isomerase-like protein (cupin superfamily)
MSSKPLSDYPIHLGRSGNAGSEPTWSGDASWYDAYELRHRSDGAEGRLVSEYLFSENWEMWERHPAGDEVVYCLSGRVLLRQRFDDGSETTTVLEAGHYAINPRGVWHTADTDASARLLFITPGEGTEHKPR